MTAGPLKLLIFQGTPFCNIDCSYCYLPNRSNKSRIDVATVAQAVSRVVEEGLVAQDLEVLWHCGEPLVLPPSLYEQFFQCIEDQLGGRCKVSHAIQTNATLLTDRWCQVLRHWNVKVGVSLDGPRDLHNKCRKDRQGKGTFDQVMKGVALLQESGIPFYVISVLHRESLDKPQELFDFFCAHDIRQVCFNVEEIEGVHGHSSLQTADAEARVRDFYLAYFRLVEKQGAHWLREYEHSLRALFASRLGNSMVTPYEMLTVDHAGNYATYAPELLNARLSDGSSFVLGNVHDQSLSFAGDLARRSQVVDEIDRGTKLCQMTCQYFDMCGGGSPSNKLAEHKTFVATETVYCRFGTKAPLEAMALHLKGRIGDAVAATTA